MRDARANRPSQCKPADLKIFAHRERREDVTLLRNICELRVQSRIGRGGDQITRDRNAAVTDRQLARDHLQCRGLAGTVGTNDHCKVARLHRQREATQDLIRLIVARLDIANVNEPHGSQEICAENRADFYKLTQLFNRSTSCQGRRRHFGVVASGVHFKPRRQPSGICAVCCANS